MGHSTKYRIRQKAPLLSKMYIEPAKVPAKAKCGTAWRKIEEYEMLKQIQHDLEFYDEHLDGTLDDYLQ